MTCARAVASVGRNAKQGVVAHDNQSTFLMVASLIVDKARNPRAAARLFEVSRPDRDVVVQEQGVSCERNICQGRPSCTLSECAANTRLGSAHF